MQATRSRALWIFALLFCMGLAGVSAQAVTYNDSYLKGSYSFLLNRWIVTQSDNEDGVLGVLKFDGAGTVTGSYRQMQGGALFTGTLSGIYSVNANGSGSMTLTNPGGNTVQLAFTLNTVAGTLVGKVAKGMQLMATFVASGFELFTGTAVLQSALPVTFTNSYLKGGYTHLSNRWVAGSDAASLGVNKFDGAGKMTFSYVHVEGASVTTATGIGTYGVSPDGTVLMTVLYPDGSTDQVALVLNTVVGTVAKSWQFLLITPIGYNMANSGNGFRQ